MARGSSDKNRRLGQEAVGKKFGKLIVIEPVYHTGGRQKVKCICDCGNEKIAVLSQLKDGRTSSCGCLRREFAVAKSNTIRQSMVSQGIWEDDPIIGMAKKYWKRRYSDGDLSFEDFLVLSQQNCYYCNVPPSNCTKISRSENYIYNGLDRINSDGLHDKNNVVTCCHRCNWSKSDGTQEEFFTWIEAVFKNLSRKKHE